jgi:hypothetical protein
MVLRVNKKPSLASQAEDVIGLLFFGRGIHDPAPRLLNFYSADKSHSRDRPKPMRAEKTTSLRA